MSIDEHRRHLVAMATDEPDSAVEVDEMLAALNQLHRISAVRQLYLVFQSINQPISQKILKVVQVI